MNTNTVVIIGAAIILAAGTVGYIGYKDGTLKATSKEITTFEECAAAGYPIMESYPEQCRTPDGKNFARFTQTVISPGACDSDAKICPDGSTVGRVPLACEFAACPTTVPVVKGGIRGNVFLGPTCPVERDPPDPQCAERPFAADFAVTTPDGSRVITTFSSDAAGAFSVALAPGSYIIRDNISNPMPTCVTDVFVVKAGVYTEVPVSCDSGIR